MNHLKPFWKAVLKFTKTILLYWIVFSFVAGSVYLGPLLFPTVQLMQVREASADTAGPNSSSTEGAAAAGSCSDNSNWSTGGAGANDTTYTSISGATLDDTNITDELRLSNFGFAFTSSSIDGITVEVLGFVGTAGDTAAYQTVSLFTAPGTNRGDNKASGSLPTSDPGSTYQSFGGTSDDWYPAGTWTEAEIESSNFGVALCFTAGGDNVTVNIDHVRITVTYTAPVTIVSGTAYNDSEGNTVLTNCDGSTKNIALVVATSTPGNFYQSCNATTGAFSFNLGSTAIAAGTVMTLYIDGVASTFGTTVLKFSGTSGDVTDANVRKNLLLLRNDNSGTITNANLAGFDSDGGTEDSGDTDICFTSNAGALSVESGIKVRLNPGDIYDPGGTVTTTGTGADFEVATSSVAYFDSSGNTIAGDIIVQNTGGTGGTVYFDANTTVNGGDIMATSTSNILYSTDTTGTVTMGAGGTITDGNATSTFYNLTTSGSGTTTFGSDITVGGDLSVGSGTTLTSDGSYTYTVKGGDTTGDGTINLRGGTFTLTGTGYLGGSSNWTFASTTIGTATTASTTATGSGNITATSTMTIGSGSYFNLNAKTLKLTGSGWPLVINGHFKPDSSTVSYQGTATSTLVTATTTYNLDFTPAAPAGSQQPSFDLRTGATSWATATDTQETVRSLGFDSTNGVLYAGSDSAGIIYRCAISTGCERGDDWTISADTTETSIFGFAFDSTNGVMYAATQGGSAGKILSCTITSLCDALGDWITATTTAATNGFRAIIYDAANDDLYAGLGEGMISKCASSCTSGANWVMSLKSTGQNWHAGFAIDSNSTSKVIYVGSSPGGIILRCDTATLCDAGGDWITSYDTPLADINTLTFDSTNGVLFAGGAHASTPSPIYRCDISTTGSCDESTDWTEATTTENDIFDLVYDSVNNRVYAGGNGASNRLYSCPAATLCDEASDWSVTAPTSDVAVTSLAVDSTNGVVYAGTGTTDGFIIRGTLSTEMTVQNNFTITNSGGGTPTVKAPKKLTVGGNWSNCTACTFTHNSGRVVFNATATGKSVTTAGDAFYDLVFDGSGGGWRLEDNATSTYMTIKRGTVDAFSKTIALTGSGQPFVNLGTFNASTSTLRLTGTSPTYLDNHQTFNNVEIDPASGTQTYTIGNWYQSGGNTWNYRKKIVIDKTKVSEYNSLDSFPVLIAETDANLKTTGNGGGVGQSAGQDILFTDYTGTLKLDHEIEKYTASTGELVAWVRLPSLNTATDTVLYLYYGNPTVASQENITGVWDSNFKGVWHLDEGDSTAANFYQDSTSNNNDGTLTDASGGTNQGNGQIGKAMDFEGDADSIAVGTTNFPSGTGQSVSLSAWVNFATFTVGDFDHVISIGNGTAGQTPVIAMSDTENIFTMAGAANDARSGTPLPAAGVWRHLAGTCNAALGTTRIYVDGILEVEKTGATCNPNTANAKIGALFNGTGNWVDGIIDEARVSSGVRTSQWIATEYNSQSATNTFYVLGPQVASSTAITVNGKFFIGGSGGATTADLNSNDPVFDVNGNFTISSGDTFSASSAATTTAAGNFTNNGTFTHNNGTIKFDSTGTQTIFGNTTFYGFFATTTGATLLFENAKTTTIASGGTFTIIGVSGGKITLNSDSSGNQWKIYLQGTAVVNWVNLKDCGCDTFSLNLTPTNASNGGNNGSCWGVSTIASTGGGPGAVDGSGGGTARTGGGTGGGSGSTGGGSGGGSGQSGGGTGGGGGATP